ncbi:hypothetical protein ACIBCA_10675 [Kitasatospora sp. NPDC051170]|uniref:hypothetical protein n=1 Tax=Kitasatospora sp. NPDC051170 TaxID=3364056 RepID=UPI003797593E
MPAAPRPRRRRPGAVPVAVLAALAGLLALAALALTRESPGDLRDAGPIAAASPPPVAKALWPDQTTASPSAAPERAAQPAPQPVPGLTVPGHDLTTVDVRDLLGKDPAVSPEERRALGTCPGCGVRTPEFRDLTGDGHPELITTATTPGAVVLHVYALDGERVVPILRVEVTSVFSADTVGSDLWLHESTTLSSQTSSRYQWNGTVLALMEQRVTAIGPVPLAGPTAAAPEPRPARPSVATATPVPAPSGAGVRIPTPEARR